jgi:4'-phosphopantetheinyl transferase
MAQLFLASMALEHIGGHEAGRLLLAQLYETHVGAPLPAILTGPMGKPYFADSGWHFSISHTKNHAFCVLADVPVGLDAEEMDRDIRLELAPKILSAGELAQFQAAEDPRLTLLRFWVLKEAQGKLSGQGMKWHPTHTDFTLPDSRIQEIDGCLVAIIR